MSEAGKVKKGDGKDVHHKDRNLFNFLKQRFVYGLHFKKSIKLSLVVISS